ncbi:hypothetical protein FBUS_01028, partial [Fasciolopsis buskii]
QTAKPEQLIVDPLIEELQIQWTPGHDGPPADQFRVLIIHGQNRLVYDSHKTQINISATPCLLTTVQVCGKHASHGISECIYATGKALPKREFPVQIPVGDVHESIKCTLEWSNNAFAPSQVIIEEIVNAPEVWGQEVSWTTNEDLDENCEPYYRVYFTDSGGWSETVEVENTFLQTVNLKRDTLYQYTISAVYRISTMTGQAASVSLRTESPEDPKPRSLKTIPFETDIYLLWSSSQMTKEFSVGYSNALAEESFTLSGIQTWYSFPINQYCLPNIVWLFATNDSTQPSVTTAAVSQMPKSPLASPTDVKVLPDYGSVAVSWNFEQHSDNSSPYFEVTLLETETRAVTIQKVRGLWYASIKNLTCDASYIISVTAVNVCGRSPPSNPVYVSARKEAAPVSISVKPNEVELLNLTVTTSELAATWESNQPSYLGLIYRVNLQQINSSGTDANEKVYIKNNTVQFDRLSSCVNYSVGVAAKNSFGTSSEITAVARTLAPGKRDKMADVDKSHGAFDAFLDKATACWMQNTLVVPIG